MRSLGAAALVFLIGCGGGSGTGLDGGQANSICSIACLATLANLVNACPASGTCTQQLVGTTSENVCYSNGVKMTAAVTSTSSGAMSMSVSVKKNTTPCYSLAMSVTATEDVTMTFKSTSGATVATFAVTSAGDTIITCPGKTPTTLDSTIQATCATELSSANTASGSGTSDCTDGICSY